MKHSAVCRLALLLVAFGPVPAAAQDEGKVGIATGYPASIGVLWHLSPRFSIRPQIGFTVSHSSPESALVAAESDIRHVSLGLSVLWNVSRSESLTTYLAPRIEYSRTSISFSPGLPSGFEDLIADFDGLGLEFPSFLDQDQHTSSTGLGGTFGARYAIHSRFAVFGEVGMLYARAGGSSPADGYHVGTTGGAGVVFYLW
jgi:hypothetical protein